MVKITTLPMTSESGSFSLRPAHGEIAVKSPVKIAAPFNTEVYKDLNGWHPLFSPLYEKGSRVRFVEAERPAATKDALEAANEDAKALMIRLLKKTSSNRRVGFGDVHKFVFSRDLESQALIPKDADMTFHHTAPLTFAQSPWILHTETITTLFHPFLSHGRLSGIKLENQAIYWLVKELLEDESLTTLLTHMRMTEKAAHGVFRSEVISSKVRHIPLGVSFSEGERRKIAESFDKKHAQGNPVEILFTNSWHRQPANFLNRGGLQVLSAFLKLQREVREARLTILSEIPYEAQTSSIFKEIKNHPNVRIMDKRITDAELTDMTARAAIFLIPSASLHSVSVLRAMGCGAVCVVSDAPGFSEFIEHGRNGIVVKGIKDRIYTVDDDTGWQMDDYEPMRTLDEKTADSLARELAALCENPEFRKKLALNAAEDVKKKHDGQAFRFAFECAITEAAEGARLKKSGKVAKFFDVKPASPRPDDKAGRREDGTVKLVGEMNGYNIVSAGSRFIAVNRSLGPVDILKDRIGELDMEPLILVGGSEEEIRKRVRLSSLVFSRFRLRLMALGRLFSSRFRKEKR